MSAPTNFQVTGCNSFWKIHCFHFFLLKSLCYQIWPCRKIGQGHSRVIIWTIYDGLESLMLHTKFRENRPAGSGEEDFWRVFTILWAWRLSWSCDPDVANKISFPLPKEAPHKSWLWSAKRFLRRRCLSIVEDGRRTDDDGRTTTDNYGRRRTPDHWYTISSPMSLRLRWANKKVSSFKSRENIQKKSMGQTVQFRILNSLQCPWTNWQWKPEKGYCNFEFQQSSQ